MSMLHVTLSLLGRALRKGAPALGVVLFSAGCTVLDLPHAPTFELSDNARTCRADVDCASVEILSERGTLLRDSDPDGDGPAAACLGVQVVCNTTRNVCEAEVTVRDADADGAFDPACTGYPFAPFEEDCDDSDPAITLRDGDGDGQVSIACTREPGPDCDDTRNSVRSGATRELCDGFISDCDAWVDGVSPARPQEDADGDRVAPVDADCEAPPSGSRELNPGYQKTDCDDTNPYVFPGAPEVCDGVINDCGLGMGARLNEDADGDGFGALNGDCVDSEAFPKTDCDDTNAATYPGAPEVCDRLTNDCNLPRVPRLVEDADNDGFASYDAPCAAGPIPFGECINGGDLDSTTRYCPFLERAPGLDEALPNAVAVAFLDYDGDGDGDIVAGSSGNHPLRLYEQYARGQYSPTAAFQPAGNVSALRTGRLFDAKREDLVVVRPAGTVTVICNQGSAPVPPITADVVSGFSGARDAAVVRLSDTQGAVAAVSPLSSVLQVAVRTSVANRCLNQADFDLTPIALGAPAVAVAAGRLLTRATQVEDVVVVTTAGGVLLLANSPASPGGLALQPTPIATGLADARSAVVGDFDGDGRLDVVVGTATGARFLRNSPGTVTGFVTSVVTGAPPMIGSVSARDIDLDGRDDLITTSSATNTVDWWQLLGSAWVRRPLVSDFNGASAAVAGDVDGDDDFDVIGVAASADLLTWWETQVTSGARFTRSKVDRAFVGAHGVAAADMNGDGRADMVGLGQSEVAWWTVQGSASAPVYNEQSITAVNDGSALAVGDLNQDGVSDIVVADDDGVRALINSGNSLTFSTLSALNGLGASGVGVIALALGDVTGDGLLDIVGVTTTSVYYWASSGGATPTFTRALVGSVSTATALALGDTDGDGLLDIVVSNKAAGAAPGLQVFSRASLGAAFMATALAGAPPAEDVIVGDLDGDGRGEIFSGEFNLASLVAYWSWSGSAYVRHVISTEPGASWTHRLALGDIDSDGDLDLVVAFGISDHIGWFENVHGTDTGWVLHELTSVGGVGDALATADFDGDGDLDVTVAHNSDSEVVLYKNDGVAWWRPTVR